MGPISNQVIYRTWNQISGADPDSAAQQFLLRLPGLQPAEESGEERKFINSDFAAAARAGDVVRLIEAPHALDLNLWENASTELNEIGAEVAAASLKEIRVSANLLRAAVTKVSGQRELASLGVSLIRTAIAAEISIPKLHSTISEAIIDNWVLEDNATEYEGVLFRGCLIVSLVVGQQWNPERGPRFEDCEILTVAGRSSSLDLPNNNFQNCKFQRFTAELVSTASILKLNLSPAIVVLLTIVEKLFFQPGRGRDETAFPRGLDHKLRPLVPELLNILRVADWADVYKSGGKSIWRPNRSMSANARALLSAPTISSEKIMDLAKNLV